MVNKPPSLSTVVVVAAAALAQLATPTFNHREMLSKAASPRRMPRRSRSQLMTSQRKLTTTARLA